MYVEQWYVTTHQPEHQRRLRLTAVEVRVMIRIMHAMISVKKLMIKWPLMLNPLMHPFLPLYLLLWSSASDWICQSTNSINHRIPCIWLNLFHVFYEVTRLISYYLLTQRVFRSSTYMCMLLTLWNEETYSFPLSLKVNPSIKTVSLIKHI